MVLYIWGNSLRTPDEPTTRNRHAKPTRERKNRHETELRKTRHAREQSNRAANWLTTECTEARAGPCRRLRRCSATFPPNRKRFFGTSRGTLKGTETFRLPCGAEHENARKPPDGGHETAALFSEFLCRPQDRLRVFSVKRQSAAPTFVPSVCSVFKSAASNLRFQRVPPAKRKSPS